MAVEVDFQGYIFLNKELPPTRQRRLAIKTPAKSLWEVLIETADEDEYEVDEDASDHANIPEIPVNVFVHNPLHELESLAWVGIKMIADRRIIGVDNGKKRPHAYNHLRLHEQHEWARKLFFNSTERCRFLIVPHYFYEFIETLDPQVQPLGHFLQRIFTALVAQYRLAEKDAASIDFDVAGDLYILFKPTMVNNIDLEDFEGIRIAKIDDAALEEERAKRRRLA